MVKTEKEGTVVFNNIDAFEIQKFQQNRYPLLFIDYVEEAVAGKSAKGYKNFSYNEWFFPAHFEDEPNVPGFVQMEALTQMFLMSFLTLPGNEGMKTAFIKAETDFKKKIIPGDRLDIISNLDSFRRGLAKGNSTGYLNGEVACKTNLVIAIPDIMRSFRPMDSSVIRSGGCYEDRVIPFASDTRGIRQNIVMSALKAS